MLVPQNSNTVSAATRLVLPDPHLLLVSNILDKSSVSFNHWSVNLKTQTGIYDFRLSR
jgi:hypothetical protein